MHSYPTRNFGLDVLRAVAITLVLISHCTYVIPEFNATLTNGIRLLGATGVDIFFVLSGYLIGGILLRKIENEHRSIKSLFHFWKRRWLRTLPSYLIVLLLNIILFLSFNKSLLDEFWTYIFFLQNFTQPHPNFFTEAWSLSIEEYAYLILPFLMYVFALLLKKIKGTKVFIVTTSIVISVLFLFKFRFYLNVDITSYQSWSFKFRKVVLYRLDAIYYGFVLVYVMTKYNFFSKYKNYLFAFGVFLFSVLHFLILISDMNPVSHKLFFSVFYLPLISLSIAVVFPLLLEIKNPKNITSIVHYISTRSYAIYLVNYSIVLLTLQYFMTVSFYTVSMYLIITCVLSEVLYQCIEQPFLRLRERLFPRR